MADFWTTPERNAIIAALQGMATAQTSIAASLATWVASQVALNAALVAQAEIQTELAEKSLELLNQPPVVPRGAISQAETSAGGATPGVDPLPT
jgi:hypothetical protein